MIKNKKGITLISLVITIVVMLILIGVSATATLKGNLFNTAQDATDETQIAVDKEQLSAAAIAAIGEDGYVDYEKLPPKGFKGENGTYISQSGNKFIVTKDGEVDLLTEAQ